MKNCSRRNYGYVFFGLFACLLALVSCAETDHQESSVFHPEQISCALHTTSDPQAIIDEAFKKHPSGDLYGIAHADAILVHLKTLADQGDLGGMYFAGALQREVIMIELLYGKNGSPAKRFYPNDFHDTIVMASTYIYLSSGIDSEYQQKAIEEAHRIDANTSNVMTPPAWIEEAKANAQRWLAYCAAQ